MLKEGRKKLDKFSRKNQRLSSEDLAALEIFIEHEGIEST
jgi:hypothetical protein